MKTGITKLNQLQVVVALLAFGLLAGASGSAAAAIKRVRAVVAASTLAEPRNHETRNGVPAMVTGWQE
jgi:hypothetical protein